MARLTFQNVPTKTGGVISGNVSIASGSPFGTGGKHAGTIAHVQSEIAKKPKGYYDPSESFDTQSKTVKELLGMHLQEFAPVRLDRGVVIYDEREEQLQLHADGVIARINNGEIVAPDYFRNNIILLQTGSMTNEQFLRTYQIYYNNGTIHEKIHVEKPIPILIASTPAPAPTGHTDPISPTPPKSGFSLFSLLPIIIIGVIVGIFLLRRRA